MNDNIIKMANDIAVNLTAMGDIEMIPEHINKFWSPAMRKRFFELYNNQPLDFDGCYAIIKDKIRCEEYNPINVQFKERGGTGG